MPEQPNKEELNDVPMVSVGRMVLVGHNAVSAYSRQYTEKEVAETEPVSSELPTDSDQ